VLITKSGFRVTTPNENREKAENLKREREGALIEKRRKHAQPTQPNNPDQEQLVAAHRATYSTVKSATRLVSKPNHIPPGSERRVPGMVSRMVTSAENTMRAVTTTCMRTAAADELGRSSKL
jgi:hypothetical protein